ncbi:hypothetical protein BpHYR1_007343 [Brachionus plicatilis]|uniref:Uncharacterized protein n=1 Tax=Brachionus plicatilis TaxID=10195 RepID=A0A3M7PUE2_BRAPC|nr:hypothetical protein BpHYR1_007343 [Brachionus plicatilis]
MLPFSTIVTCHYSRIPNYSDMSLKSSNYKSILKASKNFDPKNINYVLLQSLEYVLMNLTDKHQNKFRYRNQQIFNKINSLMDCKIRQRLFFLSICVTQEKIHYLIILQAFHKNFL